MRRLKTILGVLGLLTLWVSGAAQLHQVGEADVSRFPEVKVRLADRDPTVYGKEHFKVMAGDTALEFTVKDTVGEEADQPKTVLVLWELLTYAERKEQNAYLRKFLQNALPGMVDAGDRINLATFAWTDLEGPYQSLRLLAPDFGEDVGPLLDSVAVAQPPGGKGVQPNHGSELYYALDEGVDLLVQETGARVLVILSAEFPNIFNPSIEKAPVIEKARKAEVSIYNYRYKVKNAKYAIDDVAEATFGLSHLLDKDTPERSIGVLQDHLSGATARAAGQVYDLTFTAEHPADGEFRQVQIVAGNDPLLISYKTGAPSLGDQLLENPLWLVIAGGMLLLLIGVLLFLRSRRKKAEAVAEAIRQKEMDELARRGDEAEEHLAELTEMQRKEEERRAQADQAQRDREAAEEQERLRTEMFSGGRAPRLRLQAEGSSQTIELPGPIVILGRGEDTDILIQHNTVSRAHAQIVYVEGNYLLTDLGSTNGTFHNGVRVDSASLRHGDALSLGDARLIFYI
ncbi:MAG: FHA domain-containing protein [Bacteroidota bacterium]